MVAEAKKHFKRKKFTWQHDGAGSHAAESIDSLMRELKAEWDAIPQDQLRKTIDSVPDRMDKCIEAKGGRFE